jgi:leucyl/phenylalanyl-tRNA---protein transferase
MPATPDRTSVRIATYWIRLGRLAPGFPDPSHALQDPNGLLAAGGELSTACLIEAYRNGIFPWYEADQPILWWSPDPRSVLFPERLQVSRSLRKTLRKGHYQVTIDRAFNEVIRACAAARGARRGTWLTAAMIEAYCRLHREGLAHSVECWHDDNLVGGLYGISLGRIFFGESMFSSASDASKVALCGLVERLKARGFILIDCQVHSEHLASLGAEQIPRADFLRHLRAGCEATSHDQAWNAVT